MQVQHMLYYDFGKDISYSQTVIDQRNLTEKNALINLDYSIHQGPVVILYFPQNWTKNLSVLCILFWLPVLLWYTPDDFQRVTSTLF